MSAKRKLIPVIFFGTLTLFAAAGGIYNLAWCVGDIFARSLAAWNDFLGAEFTLLFAWRFWGITKLSLAIYRGVVRGEQVTLRRGLRGRLLFMAATFAAIGGCELSIFLFQMPGWFTHLGHAAAAMLMLCAFTYPWSRRHPMTPNFQRTELAGAGRSADSIRC